MSERLKIYLLCFIALTAVAIFVYCVMGMLEHSATAGLYTKDFFEKNLINILGPYFAMGTAFVVVFVYRTIEGQIKLEFGPLKFEGASGPIIMWVIVYLSVCLGVKMIFEAQATTSARPSITTTDHPR